MRHALRTDDSQQAIVEALRAAGVKVKVVGLPLDLLCAVRDPSVPWGYRTLLIECKDDDGRLTKQQIEFLAEWPGEVHVVRRPQDALRACLGRLME